MWVRWARVDRRGLAIDPRLVSIGLFAGWLATSALLPVPPWHAERTWIAESEAVHTAVAGAEHVPVWSVDVGGLRQASAMGSGWSVPESFETPMGRVRFAWIEGGSASLHFATSGWERGVLTLHAAALAQLAPLEVRLDIDGRERARLVMPEQWTIASVPVGPLNPGFHRLDLRAARSGSADGDGRVLSLAVAGVAVSEHAVAQPGLDRGVFEGVTPGHLAPRPAVYVSEGARISAALGECGTLDGFDVRCVDERPDRFALGVVHGWISAALLLLAPGLAWTRHARALGVARIVLALGMSSALLGGAFLILRAASWEPTPLLLGLTIFAATVPALARRSDAPPLRVDWWWLAPSLVGLIAFTGFAVAVVPPLEDQDMEVQATAWGLSHQQAPLVLTNRGRGYFFAHPPLLHFWVAGSEALHGRLGRLERYAEDALGVVDAGKAVAPGEARRLWTASLWRFFRWPDLWPARSVNVLLAALAVALIARLVVLASRSRAAGVGLALLFVSLPEVLVRSGYGGYFAATVALSLLLLATLGEGAGRGRPAVVGSALLFLVNQKGLLVPFAHLAGFARRSPLTPAVIGSALGIVAFAAWGMAIDASSFLSDFAKEHVADRLLTGLSVGSAGYPNVAGVWREFADHFGWVFTVVGLSASILALRRTDVVTRTAGASVLIGALVFSATDWRQTKHLALLAPLAIVALGAAWPRGRQARLAALLLCGALIVRNVWVALPLLSDFLALRPSPIW